MKDIYTSGIQIKVKTGIAENLLDLLAAEELDMVIATRCPAGRTELNFEPLFDEEYVLVGNNYWSDRVPKSDAPKAAQVLCDALFLAFDEQLPLIRDHSLIRNYYAKIIGNRPSERVALYVPDLRALRDAAIAGAGITVLPRYLVYDALKRQELFELFNPKLPRMNTIYITTRRGPLHPRLQRIIAELKVDVKKWAYKPV